MKYAALLLVSATVVLGAAVEDQTVSSLVDEQAHALQTSPELTRIIKKGRAITRGRSFFETMGDNFMNYLGYGEEEEYDEYGDESDYFYPSFDQSLLGNSAGSSYSFYNPYGNYHPARDDNFEEEDAYGWGDFMFDAAIVAVPMALVLAAMPTGLFTIPIVGRSMRNNVEETLKPYELPILKAVEKADFLSYTTRDCQERIFCEISKVGRGKDASMLQKMFFLTANLTPEHYAETYGVERLFKASRDGHCEMFKCVPLMAEGGILDKKYTKSKHIAKNVEKQSSTD